MFKGNRVFLLIRIGLAIGIAVLLYQFPFYYLESVTYDARVRARPTRPVSGHVATIAIDRSTFAQLQRPPDAYDHYYLLEALIEDQPKAIVYLIHPTDLQGSEQVRERWAQLASRFPNFYVSIDDVFIEGQENALRLPPPYQNVQVGAGPLTADTVKFADDGVTRRLMINYENRFLLHAQLAQMFNGIIKPEQYRGTFEFKGSVQAFIDYHPAGTFQPVSFQNVAEKRFPRGTFKDKVVFVGLDDQVNADNYVRTPYSRDVAAMSKLELHANVIDTLIRNSSPVQLPQALNLTMTILISLLTVFVVWVLKPTRGLLILLATLIGYSLVAYLLFAAFGLWIGMAHPLLAILICYYFFIPYRLIKENRKSWEYYQKNKLLTQVEELKTNFLSMMSHDLKTPLARIQGMADIALQDNHPMSDQQKEALVNINKSSEELGYFITSILNLSRVESEAVKLHVQTKDINALLEEVIKKYEFMAKQKNISIITEFEPIFSFKMDVDLMRQVFANLVENAIKYSPDGTKVLVSTEEVDGRVLVQVADQGVGISGSEINNIFLKFYRSQNAKSSPIKGSGLGLYLAKYFVELHNGDIAVESVEGQGSTFTVGLPMEQKTLSGES
ncbi:MAG TPA: CHASE2 domain-containing protein [Bdellovibrionales bacterium]|nr:CHASE2 domain-containing protein [Bdellovibrionales bacterium]